MEVFAYGCDPESRLPPPIWIVVVGGGEVPEGAVHEGDVGVGGEEAALLHLANDGAVDRAVHAAGKLL